MTLNKMMIIGNLGADPELRYTPSGKAVTNLRVAVNDRSRGADGEWTEETIWIGVPVMQYVEPQLWDWREGRMKKVRRWIDRLACVLPFEEGYFRSHLVNATFVGHPLFDSLPTRRDVPGPMFPDRAPVVARGVVGHVIALADGGEGGLVDG